MGIKEIVEKFEAWLEAPQLNKELVDLYRRRNTLLDHMGRLGMQGFQPSRNYRELV